MDTIVALVNDPDRRERLEEAFAALDPLSALHELRFVSGWNDAFALARRGHVKLVIMGLRDRNEHFFATCQRFHDRFPALPMVAYGTDQPDEMRRLVGLGAIGVRSVVLAGVDDVAPAGLAALIRSHLRPAQTTAALEDLLAALPLMARQVVEFVLSRSAEPLRPDQVATSCGFHPRTLRRSLQIQRLPTPERLIKLCRLFHAAYLLEGTGETVQEVARAAGYASTRTLRKQCSRFLGVSPRALTTDGVQRALIMMRDALGDSRPARRGLVAWDSEQLQAEGGAGRRD